MRYGDMNFQIVNFQKVFQYYKKWCIALNLEGCAPFLFFTRKIELKTRYILIIYKSKVTNDRKTMESVENTVYAKVYNVRFKIQYIIQIGISYKIWAICLDKISITNNQIKKILKSC